MDTNANVTAQGVYNNATQSYDMQTTYSYDAMSRLAAIAGLGKSATYTRFAESNRLNTVNFGALYPQVNYSYDTQLRMTSKGLWTRTFNPKDEATQIAPAAGVQTNNLNWYNLYDAAGQLSQGIFGVMGPSGPAGTAYNYSYDQIGNHQHDGITYNAVNQPSNLTYDANGNMTAKDGKQYVYDGENRLVRILENFYDAWEQGVEFHYDYVGRCYQRDDVFIDYTDSTNNYNTPYEYIIYDGAKQIMTLDGDKNVTGKYVWQPESSGDADVILWDQDGVYSTDCNKNVVAYNIIPEWPEQPSATYYDYTPFGVPVGNAGSAKRFMFSSEEWFPTRSALNYDLLLYLYRAYSPALARFLTRDPIAEQGGVNLYCFVANNPVTNWDALGLIEPISTALMASFVILLFSGCSDSDSQSCSQDEKCRVIIREDHCNETADNKLMKYVIENSSPYTAFGVIGCYTRESKKAVDKKHKINWIYDAQGGIQNLYSDGILTQYDNNGVEKRDIIKANIIMAKEKAKQMCRNKNLCCERVQIWHENAVGGNDTENKTLLDTVYCSSEAQS